MGLLFWPAGPQIRAFALFLLLTHLLVGTPAGLLPSSSLDTANGMCHYNYMHIRVPFILTDPHRFFLEPTLPKQRQYEALRAFFVEGHPSQAVARAFGSSPGPFRVLCHASRHNPQPAFCLATRPGPRTHPKKSAARPFI